MKKLIASFAVLVTAVAVTNAASVSWSSATLSFGEASLKSSKAVSGYLVLLSGSALATSYNLTDDFDASSVGSVVSSDTDGASKGSLLTGKFDTVGDENGNSYAFVAKYVDGDSTYWNISSTLNVMSGLDPDDIRVNPASWNDFAFNNSVVGESASISGGGGWAKAKTVPEPATGALALAGIALLFRRRKA